MPEIRKDPVVDRWVIIAAERNRRPFSPRSAAAPVEADPACPFCPGAEHETPPEVYAVTEGLRLPDTPGWRLRVVPNKFPALGGEGPVEEVGIAGLSRAVSGVGFHEVIIETPDHFTPFARLAPEEIAEVLLAVKRRFLHYKSDPRIVSAQFFKNQGPEAGASLAHTHCQIIAMPMAPHRLAEELAGARAAHDRLGGCVYCRAMEEALLAGDRIVEDGEDYLVYAPWAPRFPFETWIAPMSHRPRFEAMEDDELIALARTLKRTLARLDRALGGAPYNMALASAPFDAGSPDWYHWRLEILPVTARPAGFEWGSGFFINATPPEEGAALLRTV
ncbi:MAG: galactose-1-phosphate uridylyltransferase [Nitrospinae bacterium]|nr:galactose-1-phosphate uridylyltransferase [Nitrospinota bacterium]